MAKIIKCKCGAELRPVDTQNNAFVQDSSRMCGNCKRKSN